MKRIVYKTTDSIKAKMLSTAATAKTTPPKEIKITPAIKRSPTAVLQALSSTVGVDPTAPHFAFVDDPAMIPSNMTAKKHYYFSKEMGKRAARQLAEEWPTLFAFDRDQPELPAFRPAKLADPLKVEPTEENLLKIINSREVKDAAMLYERMRSENINVSEATQKELFQLVCYYNEDNPPFAEIEEWHGFRNYGEYGNPTPFVQGGLADLLFETLPKSPQNVSTMITALCKFASEKNVKRAKKLYNEFLPTKYIFRNAFDALIRVSLWVDAKNYLREMSLAGIKPSINTWICLLECASTIKKVDARCEAVEEVIGEMRALGIEPSLATYDLVLRVCSQPSRDNVRTTKDSPKDDSIPTKTAITWLDELLNELESRSVISLMSARDSAFYSVAMEMACRAANIALAEKIVNLYESHKNEVKLPALTLEGVFYNLYLQLYVEVTPSIEDVERKYRSLVPRLVGSNKQLTLAICDRLQQTPHWPLLRRLVEDGHAARQSLDFKMSMAFRRLLLDVAFESLNVVERAEYVSVVNKLVDIRLEHANFDEKEVSLKQKMQPYAISQCALLLHRIGESDKAYKMLEMILDENNRQGPMATVEYYGEANIGVMLLLFDSALREGDAYRAAICLEVISLSKPKEQLEQFASQIHKSCKLTEAQSLLLDSYVRLRPE